MKKSTMQGVIVKYIEERGFGFIKDENDEKRFFHISSIKDKKLFIENISTYLYSDFYNENCCIVEFIAGTNEKGLTALSISLTDQILNNKLIQESFKAIITDFKYEVEIFAFYVQGIKKGNSVPCSTAGSNGTYRIGYPEVSRKLNLYFSKIDGIGWGKIDVRDLVLSLNKRKQITKPLVQKLKNRVHKKTIGISVSNNKWELINKSVLIL